MHDIIADDDATRKKAQEISINALVLGEDVALVKTRQEAKKSKELLVLATRPQREVIEGPIDGVAQLETAPKKDFMHHRRSGLDQVSAEILREKGAAVVLSMHALRHAKNPDVVLGRMLQNARIAKKHDIPLILASFAHTPEELPTPHDQHAYWRAMGIDEQQVADSQQALEDLLAQAKHRASDAYIAEGVSKTQ